jgi:hypothetical protein
VKLSTVRSDLAAIIAAALPNDMGVIDYLPDAIAPPCALIGWSDPWLRPTTLCNYEAMLEILCVAQRIEPGGKLEVIEEMVSAILPAIKGSGFVVRDATSLYPLQIGGVDYLAATINVMYDVD